MTLRAKILGTGSDLVLLHGWALHGGVWLEIAQRLSAQFRVTVIDLPGHGHSGMPPAAYTLPHIAGMIAAALPRRSTIVGWSLGGMVAMQLALDHPERIGQLVLVASTPQFTASKDWPYAIDAATMEDFAAHLMQDYKPTISRFLALQVLGDEDARPTLARLKAYVAAAPAPQPQALAGGLEILRSASLTGRLTEIGLPVTLVHGDRDRLVPPTAAEAMAVRLPSAALHLIKGAGHAPFLSHPNNFLAIIDGLSHE